MENKQAVYYDYIKYSARNLPNFIRRKIMTKCALKVMLTSLDLANCSTDGRTA
jgi:hypothetical protein